MIEVFNRFEQEAGRFDPTLLVVAGLVLAGLGLIVWLAGMCLRRLVLAMATAAAGGLAGWLIQGHSPVVAGLAAGGGAVFGAILPRLSTTILLATLGVAVAFVIAARASLLEGHKPASVPSNAGRRDEKRLTVPQSVAAVRVFALDVVSRTKAAARELEPAALAVVGAVGLVLLVLGFLLVRLAGALVCSMLGTILVFVGLIVLLIFKGSAPITFVEARGPLFGLVLPGLTAFGTLEQLVLCPWPRHGRQAQSGGQPRRQQEPQQNWRDR